MLIRISLLLVLFSSIECMTFERTNAEPFRSRKAPSQTIHNYTVVYPVITSRTDKDGKHPVQFSVRINEVTVHLKLNKGLFPAHFTSRYFNDKGEAVNSQGHVNCYYQGWVEGHPEWKATMSTCHGLRGSFGDSSREDQFYHVEPLDPSLTQLDSPHVLYLESEYEKQTEAQCGTPHSAQEGSKVSHLDPDGNVKTRLKRQNSLGEKIVEWAVINDRAQFQQYDSVDAAVERALEITNYLDMLYRSEYRIRIALSYVETWNTGDRITIASNPESLLDNFEVYSLSLSAHRDSTMLFTGIDLDGNTVGIANIAGMCTRTRSVGLTQDTARSVESTGATAAHELGHIFNMDHDDSTSRSCTCTDPSGRCIMASISGSPSPSVWSTCSRLDLDEGFSNLSLDSCLLNMPDVILGPPECGNGLREDGEACDCGTPNMCTDPCCNATSCQLVDGAQCFSGSCCDNCMYRPYGTTCRDSTQECDITEYCSGESSDCPEDFRVQNGQNCNGNTSYCFSGTCLTYDSQCQIYFSTNKGVDGCYVNNQDGDGSGNCGHDITRNTYIACAPEDVMCGVLYCEVGQFNNVHRISTFLVTVNGRDDDGVLQRCRGSVTSATSDAINPGLVDDGTKCGENKVCFQRRCVELSSLNIPPCPVGTNGQTCSGNGVCNNDNMCSCNVGFSGSACDVRVQAGMPPDSSSGQAGAIAGGVIGALLIIGLIVAAVVVVVVVVLVMKFGSSGKYSTSKSQAMPPPRTTAANKPTSVGVRPNKPPPPSTAATRPSNHPPARTPPPRPHNGPPTHTPPTRPHNGPPTRTPPTRPHNGPPTRTPPTRPQNAPPTHTPPPHPLKNDLVARYNGSPANSNPPSKPVPSPRPPPPPPASQNAPPPSYKSVINAKPPPPAKPSPATRKPLVPPKP